MANQEFTEEEAASVLARALEGQSYESRVSWQDLLAIAKESGISEEAVMRAVQAESLAGAREAPAGSAPPAKQVFEEPLHWWMPESPEAAAQTLSRSADRVRIARLKEGIEVTITHGRERSRAILEPSGTGCIARPVASTRLEDWGRRGLWAAAIMVWLNMALTLLASPGSPLANVGLAVFWTAILGVILFVVLSAFGWLIRARRALTREALSRALRSAYGFEGLLLRESRSGRRS